MLVLDDRRFIQATFSSEEEIEKVVAENSEYIFGPASIYFPKALIRTIDGVATIPDGFVIDLASRQWYMVEAELSSHNVWAHIAPQVAKQITAARTPQSRRRIAQFIVDTVRDDETSMDKFLTEGIQTIDIHRVVTEILEKPPIIGMPIDNISNDLKEWATTLRTEVKLWVIKKYIEFGKPNVVMYEFPEEFEPAFDTQLVDENHQGSIRYYDVKIRDLINAGILSVGEPLFMTYRPQGGMRHDFNAIIQEDGSLSVVGETFNSPSYAALFCLQNAGSMRKATNGWTGWKNSGGKTLAELRDKYLAMDKQSRELG